MQQSNTATLKQSHRSFLWAGVSPSSFFFPAAFRFAARARSTSRWFPRDILPWRRRTEWNYSSAKQAQMVYQCATQADQFATALDNKIQRSYVGTECLCVAVYLTTARVRSCAHVQFFLQLSAISDPCVMQHARISEPCFLSMATQNLIKQLLSVSNDKPVTHYMQIRA
jgi:hypothetical protein